MHHLKELGVDTSKASMKWVNKYYNAYGDDFEKVPVSVNLDTEYYQSFGCAFTLQDILDLLPKVITKEENGYYLEMCRNGNTYYITYYWLDHPLVEYKNEKFIDAAYEMLCWCIENGYLETK